jgi:hypothetical protein
VGGNPAGRSPGSRLFPIRLCEGFRSESFLPPLFAAQCSSNLVVAAQRIARYKTLVASIRFDVAEARDVVTVELTWLDTPLSGHGTRRPCAPSGCTYGIADRKKTASLCYRFLFLLR